MLWRIGLGFNKNEERRRWYLFIYPDNIYSIHRCPPIHHPYSDPNEITYSYRSIQSIYLLSIAYRSTSPFIYLSILNPFLVERFLDVVCKGDRANLCDRSKESILCLLHKNNYQFDKLLTQIRDAKLPQYPDGMLLLLFLSLPYPLLL